MTRRLTRGQTVAALLGALVAFYVGNRATEHVQQGYGEHMAYDQYLPTFWTALKGQWFHLSMEQPALVGGVAGAALLALVVLYAMANVRNSRPGEEQGSAKWAKSGQMKRRMRGTAGRQIRLTKTESLSTDSFKTKRNLNVLVAGGSGTGKTRSYILPNMEQLEASMAITDPKGEIYRASSASLTQRGYAVRVLNLVDLDKSMHFNPFVYFNPGAPETGVAMLTECIIANTNGRKPSGGGDQFWERAEKALLTALIAYVWATTVEDGDTEPNLPAVLELHKGMGGSEENKDARDSETDIAFQAAREIVADWQKNPDSADDPQVMKVLDFACRQYAVYEQGPVETRMSIVISLGVRLAPLDMHDVREILRTDTIGINRLGYEKSALYLIIPDTHQTFRFVAAMFWQTLFEHTIYQADHEEKRLATTGWRGWINRKFGRSFMNPATGGRLPEMLHCLLDEFPNLGVIPNFERIIATIRSRNISTSVVVQNYTQGKALFEKDWEGIVGNCDTKLFLGGDDPATTEWISKRLGDETIVPNESSRTYGMNGSYSRSQRVMKRALMDPSEVSTKLEDDYAILMIRGMDPYLSKKIGR